MKRSNHSLIISTQLHSGHMTLHGYIFTYTTCNIISKNNDNHMIFETYLQISSDNFSHNESIINCLTSDFVRQTSDIGPRRIKLCVYFHVSNKVPLKTLAVVEIVNTNKVQIVRNILLLL